MNVTKVDCSSECVEHGWDGLGQALHKSRLWPLLFEHLHLITSRKIIYEDTMLFKVQTRLSMKVSSIQSYAGPDPDIGANWIPILPGSGIQRAVFEISKMSYVSSWGKKASYIDYRSVRKALRIGILIRLISNKWKAESKNKIKIKDCRHRILFRIKMFGYATLEIRKTVSRAQRTV
jgi:hypothetical protein